MTDMSECSSRVLLIGLDGATLDVIRPWAEAGLLPTFHRLMANGAWGELRSTMPPITPTAWSSLATGLNPGKHGVLDFYARRPGGYDTYLVNATHRHGAVLWNLLSRAGRRVTLFNVPATYPPEVVNGQMVSGLLTPADATDAAWPPDLLAELKQAVPGFGFYPPGTFSKGQEAAFIESVLEWDRMTLRAAEFLVARRPWDFLFAVFIGIDIVSHFFWGQLTDRQAAQPLARAVERVYRQADEILARLLGLAGEDTHVLVVSDHGFGPLDHYMHLNVWLARQGYLHFRRDMPVRAKALAFRLGLTPVRMLNLMRRLGLGGQVQKTASERGAWLRTLIRRFFLSLSDVDWSRTTAYSTGFGGPIFVNLRGRQPQGIVAPGAEYEALLERLAAGLRALRHPDTGEPFLGPIYRPADLYHGPYLSMAPDLMFEPADWSNQAYGLHDFASNRWLEPSPDRTGTHRMNGVVLASGPGIRRGCPLRADIVDIAPTVLALMGAPIPRSMDGRVLSAALDDDLQGRLAIGYVEDDDAGGDAEGARQVMSEDEEQEIRARLAALGYLG